MSLCIEVVCGFCGKALGVQYRPGDGAALFGEHVSKGRCGNPQAVWGTELSDFAG